jgi:hypothetical protein
MGDGEQIALESAERNKSRYAIFGKCIASAQYERTRGQRQRAPVAFVAPPNCSVKGNALWNLEITSLFGIRRPEPVFFLESKCAFCGALILTRSIEEVVELEQLHRAACTPSNSCCIAGLA